MHCEPRPDCFRYLFLPALFALTIAAIGCGNRSGSNVKQTVSDAKGDPVASALNRLEKDTDAAACREVLQVIDSSLASSDPRPDPDPALLQKIGELARLTPAEIGIDGLAAKQFSALDPDYLAECLLLRDAVRSLELKDYPPEVQASLAFAWVCRQVYLIDQVLPPPSWRRPDEVPPRWVIPAPPWWVLQDGSGCPLDRAVIFLAMLRQMGIDGCLIGPPALADAPTIKLPSNLSGFPIYAPVRAVGARIGKDILLFDPQIGAPIPNGNKVATLAEIRSNPEITGEWLKHSNLKADEVKGWEVFISDPVSSYAPRLEWLQRQMASNPLNLFVDLIALEKRFLKEALATGTLNQGKCSYWNAPNDPLSPTRVLASYDQEVRSGDGRSSRPLNDEFRRSRFPLAFIPHPRTGGLNLEGKPFELISWAFDREFASVFLTSGSPRDMLLRGQFSNALAALDEIDRTNTNYRNRIAREKDLEKALKEWSDLASPIFAAVIDAERKGDAAALAQANADQDKFLKSPESDRMVMLVRRSTSLLLCAEAKYLIALVVQERAERLQARLDYGSAKDDPRTKNDLKTEAARAWDNAADNWKVFLNNYPKLTVYYKHRFDHARQLQKRCQQHLADAKK